MLIKFCKHCGAQLPESRTPRQVYCSIECRKWAQAERDGKADPSQTGKKFDAPGCQCRTCAECRLYATLKSDSQIWHAATSKAERG